MPIYCGNNLNNQKLISGTHVLGTNYQCLRRGIGVGRNLPYDDAFSQPYVPVDNRKFYCGNSDILPPAGGYFSIGSPSKCMQVGVGVGKIQRAAMGLNARDYFIRYILKYIIVLFISGGIFSILYFIKPSFVMKTKNKKTVIDWGKLIPFFFLFSLIVVVIVWHVWKRFVMRWF